MQWIKDKTKKINVRVKYVKTETLNDLKSILELTIN